MDFSSGNIRGGIARATIGIAGGRLVNYYVSDVLKVGSLLNGAERDAAKVIPDAITDKLKELEPLDNFLNPEPQC